MAEVPKIQILVVDDDARVRAGLSTFLRNHGYEVREASNGIEAIRSFRESGAHLVVTDLNMPDMDGIEFILAVREEGTGVRVIAMSGGGIFDKKLLLDNAGALGADVTLEKPFDLEDLRKAVVSQVRHATGE